MLKPIRYHIFIKKLGRSETRFPKIRCMNKVKEDPIERQNKGWTLPLWRQKETKPWSSLKTKKNLNIATMLP